MPNWAIHLIVPLLALIMVSRKEDWKYVLLLLPLAVVSDVDTFVTQHRALLHNILIWTFDYGFDEYGSGWKTALGYVTDSPGTASIMFVLFAGMWAAYRRQREDT